jgi:hypothetical protein
VVCEPSSHHRPKLARSRADPVPPAYRSGLLRHHARGHPLWTRRRLTRPPQGRPDSCGCGAAEGPGSRALHRKGMSRPSVRSRHRTSRKSDCPDQSAGPSPREGRPRSCNGPRTRPARDHTTGNVSSCNLSEGRVASLPRPGILLHGAAAGHGGSLPTRLPLRTPG